MNKIPNLDMNHNMIQLRENLIQRLEGQGIENNVIPGFVRSLANSFLLNPQMSVMQVNKRLHYLGWTGVELDYHTFQLAVTWFESEGLNKLEYKSATWFEDSFFPNIN